MSSSASSASQQPQQQQQQKPITREYLRSLKRKAEEQQVSSLINKTLEIIYTNVITHATKSDETFYRHAIPTPPPINTVYLEMGHTSLPVTFATIYNTHLNDILQGLRELFPDSTISKKILTRGSDGKLLDITDIPEILESNVLKTIHSQWYIVIDWS